MQQVQSDDKKLLVKDNHNLILAIIVGLGILTFLVLLVFLTNTNEIKTDFTRPVYIFYRSSCSVCNELNKRISAIGDNIQYVTEINIDNYKYMMDQYNVTYTPKIYCVKTKDEFKLSKGQTWEDELNRLSNFIKNCVN